MRNNRRTNAIFLGLDKDDQSMHDDRIRLWDEFNNCWFTVLQKQLDMTRTMTTTGRTVQLPQSLMNTDTMEMLGRELVRMCDPIETLGLVDYQMGVAEERILDSESESQLVINHIIQS